MNLAIDCPNYDPFAHFYNQYWGQKYCNQELPIFEQLLLSHLTPGSHLLELGCGTGQLAQNLQNKGYQVTGLDMSASMLEYAAQNSPDSKFILGDIRDFKYAPQFQGVFSTSALNHVMSLEELTKGFYNVYSCLLEKGWFVFDFNLEAHYKVHWHGYIDEGDVRDEYAWATYVSYNPEEKLGQIKVTIFQLLDEEWKRQDIAWNVRCYDQQEIQLALQSIGFKDIAVYDAEEDLGKTGAAGQCFFVCRKS
jgi:SAM-dependent methyltransferase